MNWSGNFREGLAREIRENKNLAKITAYTVPKTYKIFSEKWNLTAKFNYLQAIYFYAPSALAVPMCADSLIS